MKRRFIWLIIIVLVFGIIAYISRGPDVSNALKRLILPELELATGKKFIAQKIYINILPLFVEMKEVKAFDENGTRIFTAKRIKGYIGLSGLLRKEITIRRLLIKEPQVITDKEQIEDIVENIKRYLSTETKIPYKLIVKSVDLEGATVSLSHNDSNLSANNFSANMILSEESRFRMHTKDIKITPKGFPEISGSAETFFTLRDDHLMIKSLKLTSGGSDIKASGSMELKKLSGEMKIETDILVENVKDLFSLKHDGKGRLNVNGIVKIEDLLTGFSKIFVDMKLKGDMYLETLMEFLNVKERLSGSLDFAGELKGYLNNLEGKARAKLSKGNIFGVETDRLSCNVSYKSGKMRFTEGSAALYNGTASVEAEIELPVVNNYSFKVVAKDVSSKGIFGLIKWDPKISEGRVSGEIASSGSSFNPYGRFYYKNTALQNGDLEKLDILNRIKEINGEFNMSNEIIQFPVLTVLTDRSSASSSGNVDLKNNRLNFSGTGKSDDIKELSSPYFTAVSSRGAFSYNVSGLLNDPMISLNYVSNNALLSSERLNLDILNNRNINFQKVELEVAYRKNLLNITNFLSISGREEYRIKGKVNFKNAQELFDLKEPDYDLNISVRNASIKNIADTFRDSPRFDGNLNADFRLYGRPEDIKSSGEFHARDFSLDRYSVDTADGKATYEKQKFSFSAVQMRKKDSSLNINGIISIDKKFLFFADGQRINLDDIVSSVQYKELLDIFYLKNIRLKGEGTFEKPFIELRSDIHGGIYRGYPLGSGNISAVMSENHLELNASVMDRRLNIKGNAELTEKLPWSAKIDIQPSRYDFIIEGFLKDIPEDLLLNLSGNITAHGDRDHANAEATINRAHLQLYGIGFTNSSDIKLTLQDRKLFIRSLNMKSDATEFKLSGSMDMGKNYELILEGSSSLSPLKALSKSIEVIKGDASFIFSVSGRWDMPRINGGLDVDNGVLGIKNIPYRLTSLNAFLYIDEDRIIIEKIAGKLSGGDITVSGTAYLQRFSLKKFFIESRLNNVTTTISKDFWANFDGNLYYRGTLESQTLLGDISIKKAKYSERVEWKSWLLKARMKEKPRIEGEPTKLHKTNLNVKVSGANLAIDNNVARAFMKADLLLRGTVGNPILIGKAETREGVVYFRNNEFKVLKASVDFSDTKRINPYFDIIAETRVRNYNIRLGLDGYVEQFNLSLSSDPALEETDIFSLLTVGQIGRQLKGLEGGIGAGEATSFLTGKLQDIAEERLRTITGFDRIQIDPYVSKSTGTVSPRITLAKRLMGDKLYVTYSTSAGTGEEQVWKLEYNIGHNTSLIGIRDERGGLGGDIKFRFEFK